MPSGVPHFPDPDIQHGVFRVLPRTDGGFIVYDPRRKLGSRQVGPKFKTLAQAETAARSWHLAGHG